MISKGLKRVINSTKRGNNLKDSTNKECRRYIRKLVSMCIILVIAVLVFSLAVFASQTPHGIKGFILAPDGSQIVNGTNFTVNDTTSTYFTNGTTGGPTSSFNGFYSVYINGSDGDTVDIVATNGTHYGKRRVTLFKDMSDINVTINIDNDAPYLATVSMTPDLPSKVSNIQCVVTGVTDPNDNKVTVNYSWFRNGVEQPHYLQELLVDNHTLFYANFNQNANATFAQGENIAKAILNTEIQEGKIGNALNYSATDGDVLEFNATDNFNVTQGTLEFWANFRSFVVNGWLFTQEPNLANKFWLRQLIAAGDTQINFFYGAASITSDALDWKTDEWHHIAITWSTLVDPTIGTTVYLQMFLDGILEKETTSATAISTMAANFTIGRRGALGVETIYDEFRIYDRAQTPQEIFASYSGSVLNYKNTSVNDTWHCAATPSNNLSLIGPTVPSTAVTVQNYEVNYSLYDGTSNATNTSFQAGKPIAVLVKVFDGTTPINGAEVRVTETNGYNLFAYVQTESSNFSNSQYISGYTNSSGEAHFLVSPTGGRTDAAQIIEDFVGNYNIKLEVFVNDQKIYFKDMVIERQNRAFSKYQSSGQLTTLPNLNDYTASMISEMLNAYNKIGLFLRGIGTG